MKSIRYLIRLSLAFFSRFKAIIIIGVLSGIALFFVIGLVIPILFGKETQKIGLAGRFTTDKLPVEILNLIGDGLTRVDEKGDISPNLAKSWETPDKGKTWVFTLDEEKVWQDGETLRSQDVNYQFSDLTSEKPDEKTIVFKLSDPYSPFPSVVSRPVFKKGLLGTGKWRVKNIKLSGTFVSQITLEGEYGRIIYKFYPTEDRLKLAFKLGEVDRIENLLNPEPFDSWKRITIESKIDKGKFVAVFFNNGDASLASKTFRQALTYAINKSNFKEKRAISPLSEDSWAFNPQVKTYDYDIKKAKEEIKEGFEITLTTTPILLETAELIKKDWEAVGLKVNLQVLPTIPENYQALLAIFDIPEDPDQYSMWHSTQTATNITNHSNPRIDKLLEDGRAALNLEERRRIYLDFQRFLVEDSPAAFLYYPSTYSIQR